MKYDHFRQFEKIVTELIHLENLNYLQPKEIEKI